MAGGFRSFLQAVRTRWLLHRAIDAMLLSVSLAGLIVVIWLIWQPIVYSSLALLFGSVAAAALICACWQRPRLLEAARLADVALNTSDLLSTSLKFDGGDAEFANILRGQADAFCREHRVSEITFPHRSSRMRMALLLSSLMALNIAWLCEPPAAVATSALAPSGMDIPSPLPIESPERQQSEFTKAKQTRSPDDENASAADRTFETAKTSQVAKIRRMDAPGSARGQTADAVAPRLLPAAALVGPAGSEGSARADALTADNGFAADALPAKFVPVSPSSDRFAAEPPTAYRDLIRAYFSVAPH